ncbi:MAG: response regulator [Candidatus Paceibacterota bacterium]
MEEEKKKRKILLVDDDEMMRIFFRDIFWMHGKCDAYDVEMASSLEEAEKIIEDEKTRPDIMFLDIFLSSTKKKGNVSTEQVNRSLEFIGKIKESKVFSNINIIIYSGQKYQALEEAVMKLGVDGYLIKGELMPKEIISFTDQIHGTTNH